MKEVGGNEISISGKSSATQGIAKVIATTNRKDGYLEGNGYIVSQCVIHLEELTESEIYDEMYK